MHSRHSNIPGVTGSLWDWLWEYMRRLERGLYALEPAHMNDAESDSFLMISHFQAPTPSRRGGGDDAVPSPTSTARTAPAAAGGNGGDSYLLPSSKLTFRAQDNCLQGHSRISAEGVEVTFCPVFLPNFSRQHRQASAFTWAYSIRLRLLREVPLPADAVVTGGKVAHYSSRCVSVSVCALSVVCCVLCCADATCVLCNLPYRLS